MKHFTCEVEETTMHRYVVVLNFRKLTILVNPAEIDSGTNNARRIADFINENVAHFSYAMAPEDIAVDLRRKPN